MRYHCAHCDERFSLPEADAAEPAPRCPKCLRQNALRSIEAEPSPATGKRPWLLVLAGLLVVAVGGYVFVSSRAAVPGAQVPAQTASWLHADACVEAFAHDATEGKALVAAFARRMKAQAFVPWTLVEPRADAPMDAARTCAALRKDGARLHLYPVEVAGLAVASLRSRGVAARLVEVFGYPGERAPLDPSGRLGYYALAVPGGGGKTVVFDVYGGRGGSPAQGDANVLDDAEASGAMLALQAMHELAKADPKAALARADAAVKLAPRSPSVRGVRGAALLASGGHAEGERELQAAVQLRPDAPRRNNLAVLALAIADAERAAKEVAQALQAAPEFASAHLTLASVHMARGERDLARAALQTAERLDPSLPALPLAWAELLAGSGELSQALARAEEAVRARPKSIEARLVLARIFRQAARYDEMREQARAVLQLAAPGDKERVTAVLRAVLGPTALEPPVLADDAPVEPRSSDAGARDPGTSLQLGTDSRGLLQGSSPTPRLRLQGTGSDLKLKLDP